MTIELQRLSDSRYEVMLPAAALLMSTSTVIAAFDAWLWQRMPRWRAGTYDGVVLPAERRGDSRRLDQPVGITVRGEIPLRSRLSQNS